MVVESPLRSAIVEGPLAFHMRRVAAARAGESGLQILNLPQLAARLVGGFVRPIAQEILQPLIQTALAETDFKEIEPVSELPSAIPASVRPLLGIRLRA